MPRTLARTLLGAVAATVAAVLLGSFVPATPAQAPALPDLVGDPVDGVLAQEILVDGDLRRLIRFNGYIHNTGAARLAVQGTDRADRSMETITQEGVGPMPPATTVKYESSDGHNHWHLGAAAGYALQFDTPGREHAAPAHKVGFCLLDTEYREGSDFMGDYRDDECQSGQPGTGSVEMVLSPGWRDVYPWNVWLQWVDVSDVQPGKYRLSATMDPNGLIAESDNANNTSNPATDPAVTLEGWRAKASTLSSVPVGEPTTVQLQADKFDDPAIAPAVDEAEFQIVDGPQHGTIDKPEDVWFSGGSVVYTPEPGSSADGTDEITFMVRERDAPFPEHPATAKVALRHAAAPVVTISGAPGTMVAGTSVQLGASRTPVTWSATGGTVTSTGMFSAPKGAAGTTATVTATTDDGATDTVTIKIVKPKPVVPIPGGDGELLQPVTPPGGGSGVLGPPPADLPGEPGAGAKPKPAPVIGKLSARRSGRFVTVSLRPGKRGRLRVSLLRRAKWLRACRTTVRAGRPVSCRFTVRGASKGLRVVATLDPRGKRKAVVKRAKVTVPRVHRHASGARHVHDG